MSTRAEQAREQKEWGERRSASREWNKKSRVARVCLTYPRGWKQIMDGREEMIGEEGKGAGRS